jgi:phenylacetate-coenzyme A ligase PaaK-like adenylate-forming protein
MVHVAYGYGLFTGGLGAHYGAERWAAPWCRWAAARPKSRCS